MAYVFKLNLGAKQVNSFNGDEKQLNQTIFHVLSMAFEIEKQSKYFKINFYPDKNLMEFKVMIEYLKEITQKLYELYIDIITHYENTGEITYPKNFVSLNNKCGKLRNQLVREFPVLDAAFDYSDESIITLYNIPIEYQVGKGKNHLIKFKKIEKFIEVNNIEDNLNESPIVYYDNNEHFFIEAVNEVNAELISKDIVTLMNENELVTRHLGSINILPIIEDIKIKGQANTITYEVVYPNGSKERHEKILNNQLKQLEESDGDQATTKISGQNPLDLNFFNKLFKFIGQKGYLKKIELPKSAELSRKIKEIDMDDD